MRFYTEAMFYWDVLCNSLRTATFILGAFFLSLQFGRWEINPGKPRKGGIKIFIKTE